MPNDQIINNRQSPATAPPSLKGERKASATVGKQTVLDMGEASRLQGFMINGSR